MNITEDAQAGVQREIPQDNCSMFLFSVLSRKPGHFQSHHKPEQNQLLLSWCFPCGICCFSEAAASDNSNSPSCSKSLVLFLLTWPVPNCLRMKIFSFLMAACGKITPKKKNFKTKNVELCPLPPSGRDLPFRRVRSEQVFGCSYKEKPNSGEVPCGNNN